MNIGKPVRELGVEPLQYLTAAPKTPAEPSPSPLPAPVEVPA